VTEPEKTASTPATAETVESVVRAQLSRALGGKRGMVEAAVPTIIFPVSFLLGQRLGVAEPIRLALMLSLGTAGMLLLVRLLQRSTVQFVLNSLLGIGVGALFAWRAARGGGDANDQALAYFLPGLLYNAGYAVVISLTILVRWPFMGFLVGSVAGDLTAWHRDRQLVRLCSHLSWLLVLPCVLRVAVQTPVYLAGVSGSYDPSAAVAVLAVTRLAMGWPLQLGALAAMVWLLARDRTPVDENEPGPSLA
jgi:hypothetical protein